MDDVLIINYDSHEEQQQQPQQQTRRHQADTGNTTNNASPLPDLRQTIDRRVKDRSRAVEGLRRTQRRARVCYRCRQKGQESALL